MRHLDLFSGIGGFALAVDAVWPGAEHIFCDNDPFCQAILKKHWPQSKIYGDIKSFTNTRSQKSGGVSDGEWQKIPETWSGDKVDLLTGGFPCQPFSHAGKRKGTDDDRHLWPEMRRVIQEFSPRFVVAENVRGLLSINGGMVFEQVCLDLEAIGYEVQPFVIPACAVNAPHRRDRIWFVARNTKHDGQHGTEDRESSGTGSNSDAEGQKEICQSAGPAMVRSATANASSEQTHATKQGRLHTESSRQDWSEHWPTVATRLCSLDDGLPDGLVRPRGWRNAALKAAGNAIVPQVAIEILKTIKLCPSPSKT